MFTISQIKEAHAKVKSGADFPTYIQELIALGVERYSNHVSDGHTDYAGRGEYKASSEAKYAALQVADKSDAPTFKHLLKQHQQGQSNFLTFCRQSAECGVEKWIVDMEAMTCTYYDKTGQEMLIEQIPMP